MILTRFVAMTCVVIIYLFTEITHDTKNALFVRICLTRLHGDLHTRRARGRCVVVIVIINDDGQLDSRT
jgi:hypothetical protein